MTAAGHRTECELGLSSGEFARHLPYALRGYSHRQGLAGGVLAEAADGRRVTITVTDLPDRRLSGLLVLPRCLASFVFEGFDEGGVAAFMANFARAFQRGGG